MNIVEDVGWSGEKQNSDWETVTKNTILFL